MDTLERRPVDHDAAPGPLKRCQITGSENLNLVIDLGHQPPCDALVTDPDAPETTYPLRLMHCPDSGLAQLDYVVPGDVIYPPEYPYRAGISWPLREYQAAFADRVMARFGPMPGALVVDIGSNDGTLLTGFARHGCRVLGIEPTDIAKIAQRENDVETIQEFFTEELVRDIVGEGRAKIITMTNVFAHMAGLGEVMRGIRALLDDDGIFITESHYLLDVLEKTQFDTIYHEHIRTYSLKALCLLFPQYGMEVFDVERGDRYGGNIRAYVARRGVRPVEISVGKLLAHEERVGLHEPQTWRAFAQLVNCRREQFMTWLNQQAFRQVVGCSAPGRAATLLNYYGVKPGMMRYTGELQDSLKLGKFMPGCHLPIVDNRRIIGDQPDFIVLLAWHYAEPIAKRLRAEGVRSKLVAPLPEFRTLDA